MEMKYSFAKDYSIKDIVFEGLSGREYVTSVKEALNLMKVKNPAVTFSENAKRGVYDELSDEEYEKALAAVKCISALWRYPDEPEGKTTRYDMNILMLLTNALDLVSRQSVALRRDGQKEDII